MKWDLTELRNQVLRLFGEEQRAVVNRCIRSLIDRRNFSRYHFNEARERMAGALQGREGFDVLATILGAFDTEDRQFCDERFRAGAQILACVHNMHAVGDNLCYFVYHALGLNLDPSTRIHKERDVKWSVIRERLPDGQIKDRTSEFLSAPGFRYLDALNNHCKHRSLIEVIYSADTRFEEHGLQFAQFSYGGKSYPVCWVRQTLDAEYRRQEELLVAIGNAVNESLRARA